MTSNRNSEPSDDLTIARNANLIPVGDIADRLGLEPSDLESYGEHVAKIKLEVLDRLRERPRGKYVLVTCITPTPLGEGKTVTTIGLGQALARIGKTSVVAIRQPSQGPTFGIKGGAAGGGYSQVVPMELINLHLTGDIHAVGAANNLLAAMIDNHIYRGNALGIDPYSITWRRVVDVNDRALRSVVVGLGAKTDGRPRQTGFDITAASEVMAILALTTGLDDLRERMGAIVAGRGHDGRDVTAESLRAAGSMTVLMKEAIKPNLLQTLEGTPAIIHAGPFANIAPGTSSVIADMIGIRTADYVVTEAGFGADLGGEKFFNIKCRTSGMAPDAVVMVVTVRAMKLHTGKYHVVPGHDLPVGLLSESPEDVLAGAANLRRQIASVRLHGLDPVVCVNRFPTDFDSEVDAVGEVCQDEGVRWASSEHWARGGEGAEELARLVVESAEEETEFRHLYDLDLPINEKIEKIATLVYGAGGVSFERKAENQIRDFEARGYGHLPICMAKTHLSLTENSARKGAPEGFVLPIRELRASVGAGFIVPLVGSVRTMPGLSSHPNAESVDLVDGEVVGLA